MRRHIASTFLYKKEDDTIRALEWLNKLPRKYPTWRLKGIEKGDVIVWSTETGLKIWKK